MNMLYIVIGLVVIVLIAVLVLRSSKAKQTPTQPIRQTEKKTAVAKAPVAESETISTEQNTTKFDPLTVAQRFMDQQRYDKAIETLERGLAEQPQNFKLLLKLLNIYAITDQQDDFNTVYELIKANADQATINDADQLKSLLEQEQTQNHVPAETNTEAGFESLDFDLSTSQTATDTEPTEPTQTVDHSDHLVDLETSSVPVVSVQDSPLDKSNTADPFDLTLDDLETADLDVNSLESATDVDDELNVDTNLEATTADDVTSVRDLNVDHDFALDFNLDLDSEDGVSSETPTIDNLQSDNLQNSSSPDIHSDDDFVLEFDDLANNSAEQTDDTDNEDTDIQKSAESENTDDFALLLANEDYEAVESNDSDFKHLADTEEADFELNDSVDSTVSSTEEAVSPFDELNFDEKWSPDTDTQPTTNPQSDFDKEIDTDADAVVSENKVFDDENLDSQTPVDVDDEFDSAADTSATSTPAETENELNVINSDSLDFQDRDGQNLASIESIDSPSLEEESTDLDFAAQFAADFDFVNTLDSNQVTLDLAGQYLHLGEYDSAKRLLDEVMNQGNSEQRNQAQELLARTA